MTSERDVRAVVVAFGKERPGRIQWIRVVLVSVGILLGSTLRSIITMT
jgi:hypothetical protein